MNIILESVVEIAALLSITENVVREGVVANSGLIIALEFGNLTEDLVRPSKIYTP